MTMDQFIKVAATESLSDMFLVGATVDLENQLPRFSMAQGGPLCLQFQNSSVILEQALGQERIAISSGNLTDWLAARPRDEDYRLAMFTVFDLFCYRHSKFDPPPTINSIVGYAQPRADDGYSGLILELSTGGIIGVDSSSEAGLRYFLDSQKAIFKREYIGSGHFQEQSIWVRSQRSQSENAAG